MKQNLPRKLSFFCVFSGQTLITFGFFAIRVIRVIRGWSLFQSQAHETYALNLPYWRLSSLVASVERKTPKNE